MGMTGDEDKPTDSSKQYRIWLFIKIARYADANGIGERLFRWTKSTYRKVGPTYRKLPGDPDAQRDRIRKEIVSYLREIGVITQGGFDDDEEVPF